MIPKPLQKVGKTRWTPPMSSSYQLLAVGGAWADSGADSWADSGADPGADASQSVIRKVVWWVVGGGTVNLTSAPGLVQVFVIFGDLQRSFEI